MANAISASPTLAAADALRSAFSLVWARASIPLGRVAIVADLVRVEPKRLVGLFEKANFLNVAIAASVIATRMRVCAMAREMAKSRIQAVLIMS